ncbi:class I SAM-dependent methyltransferase [Ruania albidiflava]|uniref:class I SAM-dependent methyltransferase n=1 Tax=Ruania albidiflava TaxID=366586 RepID=UPI0003B67F6B|nr:class I SAM-dependent methyltransferase [Ruania albidiflava]HLS64517.1 class I SAM-dependent methyltransferase [Ruania sp.]
MSAEQTRQAWARASRKYLEEYAETLAQAREARLEPVEEQLLAGPVAGAVVAHPMSGHGVDDAALARLGAAEVIGLDYSPAAVTSARRRAEELGLPCRYLTAELPDSGLDTASVDVVYTGKGALIWVPDLAAFLAEMRRILRPGGVLFVYEAHPLVPLWTWEPGQVRVREDRSYFARSHVNDTFPAGGATEHQHTLAELVTAVLAAGFTLEHLAEHPEPFWKPEHLDAVAAWDGRVPNSFSLLARRS